MHPIARYIKASRQYPGEETIDFFKKWTAIRVVTVGGGGGGGGAVGVGGVVVVVGAAAVATGPSAAGDARTILVKIAVTNFLQNQMQYVGRQVPQADIDAEYYRVLSLMRFYRRRCKFCHSLSKDIPHQQRWNIIKEAKQGISDGSFEFRSVAESCCLAYDQASQKQKYEITNGVTRLRAAPHTRVS